MRLFICMGCGAVLLFKEIDKMVCIFVPYHEGNFMYFFICGKEQTDSSFQPLFIKIFEGRRTKGFGKFVADTVFAHVIALLQIIETKGFRKAVVQQVLQFLEIRGTSCLFAF